MNWPIQALEATAKLGRGETAQIRPRGHSMQGRIEDGELVTLEPCQIATLEAGDIVLAQIQGKSYSHLVLHQILQCENGQFLVGSHQGRIDGWIGPDKIFGKATKIEK